MQTCGARFFEWAYKKLIYGGRKLFTIREPTITFSIVPENRMYDLHNFFRLGPFQKLK